MTLGNRFFTGSGSSVLVGTLGVRYVNTNPVASTKGLCYYLLLEKPEIALAQHLNKVSQDVWSSTCPSLPPKL